MGHAVSGRALSLSLSAGLCTAAVMALALQEVRLPASFDFAEPPPVTVEEVIKPADPPKPPPHTAPVQPRVVRDEAAPPVFTPIPVEPMTEAAPAAAEVGPPTITDPVWIERPSGAEFAKYYPSRALERGKSGRVVLDCIVNADGGIGCAVVSETPADWGFGAAALKISRYFRMSPRLENGQPVAGGRVTVPIVFRSE